MESTNLKWNYRGIINGNTSVDRDRRKVGVSGEVVRVEEEIKEIECNVTPT